MQKYLETSNTTAPPWIHPESKLFFMRILKIVAHSLHISSTYGTSALVFNIIIAIKFRPLPPIKFTLEKLSLGFPTN